MERSAELTIKQGKPGSNLCKLVGNNIKKYREKAGITQQKLAEYANLSQHFISQLENGRKNTKIETLDKISKVLGVPILNFFQVKNIKQTASDLNTRDKKILFLISRLDARRKNILLDVLKIMEKYKK